MVGIWGVGALGERFLPPEQVRSTIRWRRCRSGISDQDRRAAGRGVRRDRSARPAVLRLATRREDCCSPSAAGRDLLRQRAVPRKIASSTVGQAFCTGAHSAGDEGVVTAEYGEEYQPPPLNNAIGAELEEYVTRGRAGLGD